TRGTQDLRQGHPDGALEDRALRILEDRDGLSCRTDRIVMLTPGGLDERSCALPGRLGNEVILGRDLEGQPSEGLRLVETVEPVEGASEVRGRGGFVPLVSEPIEDLVLPPVRPLGGCSIPGEQLEVPAELARR